jgi:hypothetical protein
MKETFLKIIGFFIRFGVILFALFLVLNALRESFPKKEVQEGFKEIKEKVEEPLKETKERVSPEVNLPESGLKIFTQIEIRATTTASFSLSGIINGNDFYWKINSISNFQNQPKIFQFLQNLLYGWKKIQVKDEEVEDLKKLKEILKKDEIFKKFERVSEGYEFEIDKEKLKKGILEWKKEIKEKDIEEFFKNTQKISGKIFVDEKNLMKEIEIEGDSVKIIMKIENLEEEISKEIEGMDFEKFLISIFEELLFI